MTEFVVGDSRPYPVQLTINGAPFEIDPLTDTVKAAIISTERNRLLSTSSISVTDALPGSDWLASKVVVKFPRSQTASIKKATPAILEIQVTFNGQEADQTTWDDWTWFIPVELVLSQIA